MTTTNHLIRVEDHEGFGTCGHCDREGLRWIAIVSVDGQTVAVGTECAKRVLGWKPTPKSYAWVEHFTVVAEHTEPYRMYGSDAPTTTYTLWQHRNGTATRETTNGVLTSIGGVRREWTDRGWL